MVLVQLVTEFLSLLTLIGNIGLALVIILAVYKLIRQNKLAAWDQLIAFSQQYGLLLAFIIASIAMTGSLFYSEVAGYNPCKLCWLQRIFMYPQTILLWIALIKQFDQEIAYYSLTLAAIGAIIAAYHYYLQRWGGSGISCSTVGYSQTCAQNFVLNLGYITIPLMAFTAFALITTLMFLFIHK